MKNIIRGTVAVLTAVVLTLSFHMGPALAGNVTQHDDTPSYFVGTSDQDHATLWTTWHEDPDGKGVIFSYFGIYANDCEQYESNSAGHVDRIVLRNSAGNVVWRADDFNLSGCGTGFQNMQIEVNNSRCAELWMQVDMRINNWPDVYDKQAHVEVCAG